MQQKRTLLAYTLVELLVVIAIIGIIAISVVQFDFNRLSQKQEIAIEVSKIINIFEETRNNALIWRSVLIGPTLETPASWNIEISDSWSGNISSTYTLADSSTGSHLYWSTAFPFSLQNVECKRLNGSNSSHTPPLIISFNWAQWSISWCPDSSYKIISFEYGLGSLIENISINVLTGVIENN